MDYCCVTVHTTSTSWRLERNNGQHWDWRERGPSLRSLERSQPIYRDQSTEINDPRERD